MIATVVKLSWLNLRRDRTALALTFVLPIVFFSIFASVFGDMDRNDSKQINAALVNESGAELSAGLVEVLAGRPELRTVLRAAAGDAAGRSEAAELVRNGTVAAAVILPADFDARLRDGGSARVELLADVSNPLVVSVLTGLLNAAALEAGFALTGDAAGGEAEPVEGPIEVAVVDVLGGEGKSASIAYFAAGLGVLFLLFSMSNRCAMFIDEEESGVLERLLGCELGVTRLLCGRWLFLAMVGISQVTLMFVWAALAFGLPFWSPVYLAGFAVMTLVTASAAAAFGMVLALLCRSREQLIATSTVVVLLMAAIGGNLFPRFFMPEALQAAGRVTFNAWALDGYQKVFWYDAPPQALGPEVTVLVGTTLIFLGVARLLARRWGPG